MRTVLQFGLSILFIIIAFPHGFSQNENYSNTIDDPWNKIDLTSKEMKPFYLTVISEAKSFPWVPVGLGTLGGGFLIYLLTQDGEEPEDCSCTITSSQINTTCGQSNGEISIMTSIPGDYSYEWSNGMTTSTITNLSAGEYSVTVSSGGTCTCESTVVIGSLPLEADLSFNTTAANCGQPDGGAEVIVDPPDSYSYLWSNGNTTSTLTNVIAGNYSVTVSLPGEDCSISGDVTISDEPGEFNGTTSSTPADCGLSNGSATADFTPGTDYTFLWLNGETSSELTDIGSGDYGLTVTNAKGCTKEYTINVGELTTEYIEDVAPTGGDCTGDGGEIVIIINTPGTGPMTVVIAGPSGNLELFLDPGTYHLSSYLDILPGEYTISAFDNVAGIECAHDASTVVEDNSPDLVVEDDVYETQFETAITDNVLANDTGLQVQLIDILDITGGSVTFDPEGSFTFIPDDGFVGEASFTYTATDACGNTSSAIVIITVLEGECKFNAEFIVMNASCGLSDGSLEVQIIEPGSYTYSWDDGTTGQVMTNIPTGTYSVTIEDVNLNCSLIFSSDVGEEPANHINDIQTIQPDCTTSGDILFKVFSSGPGTLTMEVSHPNGFDEFSIVPAQIMLSDFISIEAGDYTVTVYEQSAGINCSETFSASIFPPAIVEIAVEAIVPPSSPSGSDGSITVVITAEGELPYSILLNGSFWGISTETFFTIGDLASGAYTIQIIDGAGCSSNILEVFVPATGPAGLLLGFGLFHSHNLETQSIESRAVNKSSNTRSFLSGTVKYHMYKTDFETSMSILHSENAVMIRFSQLAEIISFQKVGFNLQLLSGALVHKITDEPLKPNWTIKGNISKNVTNLFILNGSISLIGWDKLYSPVVEAGIQIPLLSKFKSYNTKLGGSMKNISK